MAKPLPKVPTKTEKHNLMVQVDKQVFNEAASYVRFEGITLRQAVEWGLQEFIEACKKQKKDKA